MSVVFHWIRGNRRAALAASLALALSAVAFPPAPHHLVYGLVRDELGNPLNLPGAEVLLEAEGTTLGRTPIGGGGAPGVNYQLVIPLDSGATTDLYRPSALRPTVPFRMRVKVGSVSYLPIEMTGVANLVTRPGESSRVDLTLGVDSDGDGLPDAWELALIQAMGGGLTLAQIRPEDDADGDGLTNLQEYLASTYAFDPKDGFSLTLREVVNDSSLVEFTAIRSRSYTIEASFDLQNWVQTPFRISAEGAGAVPREAYTATDVRLIRAWVGPFEDDEPAPRFFKLMVH